MRDFGASAPARAPIFKNFCSLQFGTLCALHRMWSSSLGDRLTNVARRKTTKVLRQTWVFCKRTLRIAKRKNTEVDSRLSPLNAGSHRRPALPPFGRAVFSTERFLIPATIDRADSKAQFRCATLTG